MPPCTGQPVSKTVGLYRLARCVQLTPENNAELGPSNHLPTKFSSMRIIDQLHVQLQHISTYPAGVARVPDRIAGTSFFPGGDGLWKEISHDRDLPVGGIMVLGHNFDNVAGFAKSLAMGKEPLRCPTWRNLLRLFDQNGISPDECFFTNAYVGLTESVSNVGVFPGSRDPAFVATCLEFLEQQVAALRPKLILTLGGVVPGLLARLSPSLSRWAGCTSLRELDEIDAAVIFNAHFVGGFVHADIVALTHPAQRHLNVGRRRFGELNGEAAEQAMLNAALDKKLLYTA
jgi:uracil-DNA glycosylase